jgi:predicted transcriptional regulator
VYPQLEFAPAHGAEKGLSEAGQTIIDGVRNVVVYANIGHSVFSDDGGHFYAGGGFKVVIGR